MKSWDNISPITYEADDELLRLLPSFIRAPLSDTYLSDNFVVVDLETDNEDKGSPYNDANDIVVAGWRASGDSKVNYKYGNIYEQQELVDAITDADFVVAQNAKFEFGWFDRMGLDISKILPFCTMVGDFTIQSNRGGALNLNACCSRHGIKASKIDLVKLFWNQGVTTRDIPRYILTPYLIRDVSLAYKLFCRQRKILERNRLLPNVFTRNILTGILSDIEKRGMLLDDERVLACYTKVALENIEQDSKLKEYTSKYNLKSPKQRIQLLYEDLEFPLPMKWGRVDTTQTGLPRTDAATINALKPLPSNVTTKEEKELRERQKDFLKNYKGYNKTSNMLSKYLNEMLRCCKENKGRLLFEFHQTRARTVRTSCTGKTYKVQGQNINREFKPVFIATEGAEIDVRDFGQLEWGVGVEHFQEPVGVLEIYEGFDMHSQTAEALYDVKFTKNSGGNRAELRRLAKAGTFKPLFFSTSGSKAQERYVEFFREKYYNLYKRQQESIAQVLRTKKLTCLNGYIFYFPDARVTNSGYIYEGFKICNYPIQHIAGADLALIYITYLWHAMKAKGMRSYIMGMIHDSVLVNLYNEEREAYDELNENLMKWVLYWYYERVFKYRWKTPLKLDKERDKHWATSNEWEEKWLS